MIPAEAVEAAARASYELKPVELFGRECPISWEQLSDSPLGQRRKDNELGKARAALEAAAPHIRAQALEDAAAEVDEGVGVHGQEEYADWLRERATEVRTPDAR